MRKLVLILLLIIALPFVVAEMRCLDSDGGKRYDLQGNTQLIIDQEIINEQTDYCIDSNNLIEYWCESNGIHNETVLLSSIECTNGCVNGACIGAGTCIDTDGGLNYYVKGRLTIQGSAGYLDDVCQIKTGPTSYVSTNECNGADCYLEEAYCDSPSKEHRLFPADYYNCSNGCKNGVCVSSRPVPEFNLKTTIAVFCILSLITIILIKVKRKI